MTLDRFPLGDLRILDWSESASVPSGVKTTSCTRTPLKWPAGNIGLVYTIGRYNNNVLDDEKLMNNILDVHLRKRLSRMPSKESGARYEHIQKHYPEQRREQAVSAKQRRYQSPCVTRFTVSSYSTRTSAGSL